MRIVIDMQGAQSESRFRGVGRYSLALALGIARNAGQHEIWLAMNGALADSIEELRQAFRGLVPAERICVFDIATPSAELGGANGPRARANELIREQALAALAPDAVLVTSLFEGFVDDAVTSVGAFAGAANTAVVLYDLIPMLNPAAYLAGPGQRAYYERKIASLERAGLLLSISDYSRQEGIDTLDLDPARVVSISTAVDQELFHPGSPDPQALAALHARLGINRAFLMYAPGGFDARKNIDGLITAFSQLPAPLRAAHQLVIASKLGQNDRDDLVAHARRAGLAAGELILTGYLSDSELIDLYRSTALFVFPSRHEGFGLPALEAMACGAPVIGADNTSIPEVIGSEAGLFATASTEAMCAKIAEVLGDPAARERLRAHGAVQAASFSWDRTAQRALRALEQHFGQPAAVPDEDEPVRIGAKPRLAHVCPLPPERTGIADYAVMLLPDLMRWYDIDLVIDQPEVVLPEELAALPRRTPAWFAEHAREYDQILYQFGNSPFHSFMLPLLARHPGVVVMHDFFMSGMLSHEQLSGAAPGIWNAALLHSHGYAALLASQAPEGVEAAKDCYPSNLAILQGATRVIAHSRHALGMAHEWYGPEAGRNWSVAPLLRAVPRNPDRAAARAALGIAEDTILYCSFGFIAPTKLSMELVQAWMASSLHGDARCELVLVGANHGGDYGLRLSEAIKASGAGKRIRIAGWSDDATYHRYLAAADVSVQLRSVSRGETSGAVLDSMSYSLPVIINGNGAMAELPDEVVWKVPDAFTIPELSRALEALRADAGLRRDLGQRALERILTVHSPRHCAAEYTRAMDLAARERGGSQRALLGALAALPELPADEASLQQLAWIIARNPDKLAPRQLLVDVSAIARHDLKTGIERVVRTQLLELLKLHIPGWRVEPVYMTDEGGQWHLRYARNYAFSLLGIAGQSADPVADVVGGDIYYSADFSPATVQQAAAAGVYRRWRRSGVSVNFVLYDLLPVLRPEFFPPFAGLPHAAWLENIADEADRLLPISEAVAQEMLAWLAEHRPAARRELRIRTLHLGADISSAPPERHPQVFPELERIAARPCALMVGTIEPRKGHLQALAAFEQLWRDGVDAHLVIVGKEGWVPLAAADRRTIPEIVRRLSGHPELGKRLFWLQGIDDEQLQQVYLASTCLLYPSEAEGFGLPLIEAARYGLPIIVRDLPVFREVAGAHAYYFSGLEGADLAGAIQQWLALQRAGQAPASAGMPWLTWQQNAAELVEILNGRRDEHLWAPGSAAN
ncbi:glycosyltransferase [Pseudoduganella albidiflava]|uniref:Glycosyltransferase n=1 Tax=Pseudoduganella albidiflava TaxID=321983 RepID=A0A411WTE8_9BURK|nr:glycosyltransferase [Pseudoduganella albidiflava]QBH99927.1 glycosyltransferase [Pseudoduganella albidiflava]GGY54930.1 mannosyltransferase A [Pseudoduganella albidiflava]